MNRHNKVNDKPMTMEIVPFHWKDKEISIAVGLVLSR